MNTAPIPPAFQLHDSGPNLELKLEGTLNSSRLDEVYAIARRAADGDRDLLICCERVEFLGTGVLQCLIALANSLSARGKQLRFVGVQPTLEKWLFLAGLA